MKNFFWCVAIILTAAAVWSAPTPAFASHTASHLADLVIENVQLDGFVLSYDLKNIGPVTADTLFLVDISLERADGTQISSSMDNFWGDLSLNEVAHRSRTFSFGIPDEAAFIEVTLAPLYDVAEVSTDNNSATLDLSTLPAALPFDFSVDSASLSSGAVTYRVRNAGRGRFNGSIETRFKWLNSSNGEVFPGEGLYNTISGAIESGGTVEGTRSLGVPRPGATRLRVEVDSRNLLIESNESNNTVTIDIPLNYYADLVVENPVLEGNTVTFTVRNNGGPYLGTTPMRYAPRRDNGTAISSPGDYIANIPPGESVTHAYTFYAVPTAASSILVEVDPSDSIDESNETNNSAAVAVTAGSQLDFAVGTAVFAVSSTTYTIQNLGTRSFADTLVHHLQWVNSAGAVLATSVGGGQVTLPAQGSISYTRGGDTFMMTRPAAAAYLRILVNPTGPNHIPEFDPDNNVYDMDVAATLAALYPSPDFGIEGGELDDDEVHFTIRNSGGTYTGVLTYTMTWLAADRSALSTSYSSGLYLDPLAAGGSLVRTEDLPYLFYSRPDNASYLRIRLNSSG